VSQRETGQAGESSRPHPHAEVLTLREARRDVVRAGIASDADPPRPEALRGTVTGLRLALSRVPLVQLDQTSRSQSLSPRRLPQPRGRPCDRPW